MEIEILKSEKDDAEVKIDNVTIAEILRVYLNNQDIEFTAWRREHPTKPAVLKIKTEKGTVKKAVSDAVSQIKKDLDSVEKEVKK
ncbi:hypothetical protein CMI45_00530 [Candidatus Pacearchaeota archaeon]|nr:hypothetical protein [Candidatus Pacearchaeota archaeon]|tara:strand:- start:1442 stop:1696 length:255 start_codon:yes stop_codon:yes gene_type:complete